MNKISEMKDAEELKETNVGFRFLFNPNQARSGAVLFLQWCLAPQVIQHLKDNCVTDAKVFITVRNPHGREIRYVASLASPQEFLEFHCSGKHEISGTVVWGESLEKADKHFLEKSDRHHYRWSLEMATANNRCSSFGKAEMSVEVPSGFFAPELSPWMFWYVNLWFGEPAWDECEIRRRKLIALLVQTPLLSVYIPLIFVMRLVYALFVSGVLLRKDVPWEAVVRPFVYSISDIWDRSERRWEEKPVRRLILVPSNQIMMILVSIMISIIIVEWTGLSFLVLPVVYAVIVVFFAALVSPWLEKWIEMDFKQYMAEREERLRSELLNRSYHELLCTTAPADGTLRTKRSGFKNNVVLAFQDFKANVCRPSALH
ncbi:MAG: hypothetical protein Q8P17_00325 [bacterium]|nr:hypothetical protein [bacterium]